jgi:hypothetical protein
MKTDSFPNQERLNSSTSKSGDFAIMACRPVAITITGFPISVNLIRLYDIIR